jgi:F-type H+-transporting ATPase subunit epsilon
MTPRGLTLEVVTPDGPALREEDVDVVVLRRKERRFAVGSEIAIFPGHAPLLVGLAAAPVRFRQGATTVHLAVAGGFSEVLDDRVTILTPRCERIAPGSADLVTAARS